MKCPICGGALEAKVIPGNAKKEHEWVDVDFVCSENDEHRFFVRIRAEDLIEV